MFCTHQHNASNITLHSGVGRHIGCGGCCSSLPSVRACACARAHGCRSSRPHCCFFFDFFFSRMLCCWCRAYEYLFSVGGGLVAHSRTTAHSFNASVCACTAARPSSRRRAMQTQREQRERNVLSCGSNSQQRGPFRGTGVVS